MPDCAVMSVKRIAAGWPPVVAVENASSRTRRRGDKETRRQGDKEIKSPCLLVPLSLFISLVWLAALFCFEAVEDFELTFTLSPAPGGKVSPAQLIMNIGRVRFEFHGRFKPFHRFPDVTL